MTKLPLVSVCMITYNHEKFIKEAIEGVLMQQCSFPIELIISEDCGSDSTRSIILEYAKKYSDIIVADLPESNRGMLKNSRYCMSLARGKYIALCEGDDYWIDPLKLQKQVTFLENNPEYGMVYGKARRLINETNEFLPVFGSKLKDTKALLRANPIPTLTVLFIKKIWENYDDQIGYNEWTMGDYPLWIYFSIVSKIHFINETFAVYRILKISASHSTDINTQLRFARCISDVRDFFAKKYNFMDSDELDYLRQIDLINCAFAHNERLMVIHYCKTINRFNRKIYARRLISKYGILNWIYINFFASKYTPYVKIIKSHNKKK